MRSSSSNLPGRERLHLRLAPRLLAKVKRLAGRRGVTLTSLVEDGLEWVLATDALERARSRAIDADQI